MIAGPIVILAMAAFIAIMVAGCRAHTRDWTPDQWAKAHATNAAAARWNAEYR